MVTLTPAKDAGMVETSSAATCVQFLYIPNVLVIPWKKSGARQDGRARTTRASNAAENQQPSVVCYFDASVALEHIAKIIYHKIPRLLVNAKDSKH